MSHKRQHSDQRRGGGNNERRPDVGSNPARAHAPPAKRQYHNVSAPRYNTNQQRPTLQSKVTDVTEQRRQEALLRHHAPPPLQNFRIPLRPAPTNEDRQRDSSNTASSSSSSNITFLPPTIPNGRPDYAGIAVRHSLLQRQRGGATVLPPNRFGYLTDGVREATTATSAPIAH